MKVSYRQSLCWTWALGFFKFPWGITFFMALRVFWQEEIEKPPRREEIGGGGANWSPNRRSGWWRAGIAFPVSDWCWEGHISPFRKKKEINLSPHTQLGSSRGQPGFNFHLGVGPLLAGVGYAGKEEKAEEEKKRKRKEKRKIVRGGKKKKKKEKCHCWLERNRKGENED